MKTIKVTNSTIQDVIKQQINELGRKADLNHIDTSSVTNFDYLLFNLGFEGDISRWNVQSVKSLNYTFYGSPFNGDLSRWNLISLKRATHTFTYCPVQIPSNVRNALQRATIVGWMKIPNKQ